MQPEPDGAPEAPPHVPSHVPHEPLQQSASVPQLAPSGEPLGPPQVLSHVPHASVQQSDEVAQDPPVAAQPQVPPAQVPLQQSVPVPQLAPSGEPLWPPQVSSHVPQVSEQQSPSVVQLPPVSEQELPHCPLLLQMRRPQQSLLLLHASPVPRQPHVPLPLHTFGAQQSALVEHEVPEPAHPHVDVPVSQLRAPQQSALPVQPWPLEAHPHVLFTHRPEQQSPAVLHDVPSSLQPVPVPPSSPVPGS